MARPERPARPTQHTCTEQTCEYDGTLVYCTACGMSWERAEGTNGGYFWKTWVDRAHRSA